MLPTLRRQPRRGPTPSPMGIGGRCLGETHGGTSEELREGHGLKQHLHVPLDPLPAVPSEPCRGAGVPPMADAGPSSVGGFHSGWVCVPPHGPDPERSELLLMSGGAYPREEGCLPHPKPASEPTPSIPPAPTFFQPGVTREERPLRDAASSPVVAAPSPMWGITSAQGGARK